jgi:hypothetical protein
METTAISSAGSRPRPGIAADRWTRTRQLRASRTLFRVRARHPGRGGALGRGRSPARACPRRGRRSGGVTEGVRAAIGDGSTRTGDLAVLALGLRRRPIQSPMIFPHSSPRCKRHPWSVDALAGLAPDALLLVIGTNLRCSTSRLRSTIADTAARSHAVPRHGLLSQRSAPSRAAMERSCSTEDCPNSAPRFRGDMLAEPETWRGVVDSIRAQSSAMWSSWPDEERRRFLRHAPLLGRPPPPRGAESMIASAGCARTGAPRGSRPLDLLELRPTASPLRSRRVAASPGGALGARDQRDRPGADYRTWDDPLVRTLFDRGWIRRIARLQARRNHGRSDP